MVNAAILQMEVLVPFKSYKEKVYSCHSAKRVLSLYSALGEDV